MQKQLTQLEAKVGEKIFHFICDPDSPLEHVKEALFQFGKYVGAIEDALKAQPSPPPVHANPTEITQPSLEEVK